MRLDRQEPTQSGHTFTLANLESVLYEMFSIGERSDRNREHVLLPATSIGEDEASSKDLIVVNLSKKLLPAGYRKLADDVRDLGFRHQL